MAHSENKLPTEHERQILAAVWSFGPATIREIHDAVRQHNDVQRNAVGKAVTIMVTRGFLRAVPKAKPPRYEAIVDRDSTYSNVVKRMADESYGGSMRKFLVSLLLGDVASEQDRKDIENLIREHRGNT